MQSRFGLAGGCGRYNAGAGRGRASPAPLTACFTLGYTEKTSIRPVILRTWRTCRRGAARDRSPPLSRVHLSTRSSTPRPQESMNFSPD